MKGIVWTKSHLNEIPYYNAKIGYIKLWCRPSIKHSRNGKKHIIGWTCYIYFECKRIGHTAKEKSLEFVQKKAEKLAIKYLLGYSFVTLRALKRTDLLGEMLSEIGVDL